MMNIKTENFFWIGKNLKIIGKASTSKRLKKRVKLAELLHKARKMTLII